ncbi:MAG: hypothetical protein KO206_08895 [Methanomicrobiaceae archaeon]|nr:hypothetical protein [Methanomicrobiaceae archaeon]MDD5418415.1 hypothetical protein [Methanomicrobiaceae archaeon]
MVKRQNIPVRSFGSEAGTPGVADLAAWVAERRGKAGDLVTYQLGQSLQPQTAVDIPCAGGMFYGRRWRESLLGFRDGVLAEEPGIAPEDVRMDAAEMAAARRGVWCSLPAPHLLGAADGYLGDPDEFSGLLSDLYAGLMREMRDMGVQGHVLIADAVEDAEVEALAGRKAFFYLRQPDRQGLEALLEYQDSAAVPPDLLPIAIGLLEEYRIRRLILLDPKTRDLAAAAAAVDPDMLLAGGYCERDCEDYWSAIADRAFILR